MKKLLLLILLLTAGYSYASTGSEKIINSGSVKDINPITEQSQSNKLSCNDSVTENNEDDSFVSSVVMNRAEKYNFSAFSPIFSIITSPGSNFQPPNL